MLSSQDSSGAKESVNNYSNIEEASNLDDLHSMEYSSIDAHFLIEHFYSYSDNFSISSHGLTISWRTSKLLSIRNLTRREFPSSRKDLWSPILYKAGASLYTLPQDTHPFVHPE